MHRKCAQKNKQWEKQPDGLKKLSMQGKRPCFAGRWSSFHLPLRLALYFLILHFQPELVQLKGASFLIISPDIKGRKYQQETSSFFPYCQSCKHPTTTEFPEHTTRDWYPQKGKKKKERTHTPLASTARDTIRLIELIIYLNKYNSYFISAAFRNVFLVCWSNFPESH